MTEKLYQRQLSQEFDATVWCDFWAGAVRSIGPLLWRRTALRYRVLSGVSVSGVGSRGDPSRSRRGTPSVMAYLRTRLGPPLPTRATHTAMHVVRRGVQTGACAGGEMEPLRAGWTSSLRAPARSGVGDQAAVKGSSWATCVRSMSGGGIQIRI
jgi:hypothetical protein